MSDVVLPSSTWQTLSAQQPSAPLPTGLDAIWDTMAGMVQRLRRRRASCLRRAKDVLAMAPQIEDLTDAHLAEQAQELLARFRRNRQTPEDLRRALAVLREVAFRQIGLKAHPEQVAGAYGLIDGAIVEMATGEGKSLTAVLAGAVAGWEGRGCHILTTNDYLATRDAAEMASIYKFVGLRCAAVEQETEPSERHAAYRADVTYLTNKEAAADFLRDRLAQGRQRGLPSALLERIATGRPGPAERLVQRGLHRAIVDEADSVLIDEAVTPLILSGPASNPELVDAYTTASRLSGDLVEGTDYRANHRHREVDLTSAGKQRIAELSEGLGGIWAGARRREELVTQALTARHFFLRDKQYVCQEGKVVIVDDFTGRLMPDREWRDGLHQAVTAKEELEVEPPKDTYARVSFQRFFRLYRHLSGMTGTAAEARREFWQIYHRPVVVLPTHRPCIREHLGDVVMPDAESKWRAAADEVERLHKLGRPVLIGTRSVGDSERLSELLGARNLPHRVLNAVRHEEEAQVVAEAGGPGKITVATNMAGRGTDIKLGRGVADLGGLHVLAADRNESHRVDRQLAGRAGRQGDPGSYQAFVAISDELLIRHTAKLARWVRWLGRAGLGGPSRWLARRLFGWSQWRAQRIALAQRKQLLRTDDWLDEQLGFAGREL